MLILGVDPGLRATGYAILQGSRRGVHLVAQGVIRTDDGLSLPVRLQRIHDAVRQILTRASLAKVAVEDLYTAQRFPRTAILMGHARGVVCLAAAEQGIDVEPLPPAAVKQAVAGFGGASKSQMQAAVARVLRVRTSIDAHAADAAAVALTALSRRGVPLRADGDFAEVAR